MQFCEFDGSDPTPDFCISGTNKQCKDVTILNGIKLALITYYHVRSKFSL